MVDIDTKIQVYTAYPRREDTDKHLFYEDTIFIPIWAPTHFQSMLRVNRISKRTLQAKPSSKLENLFNRIMVLSFGFRGAMPFLLVVP